MLKARWILYSSDRTAYRRYAYSLSKSLVPWLCRTLEALHLRDIVYGDLHLGNILLLSSSGGGENGKREYRLVDFGCSSLIGKGRPVFTILKAFREDFLPEVVDRLPGYVGYTQQMDVHLLGKCIHVLFGLPLKAKAEDLVNLCPWIPIESALVQLVRETGEADPGKRPGAERLLELVDMLDPPSWRWKQCTED